MGGTTFETIGRGKTAKEAFAARRAQAQHDHGHSGYSGTIAEKVEFTLIAPPSGTVDRSELIAFARKLVDDGDARVDDKWGPAGCIKLSPEEWLFFGWASC